MYIVYLIAIIYLGLLGAGALFLELSKWHWFWRLVLGGFAVVAVAISIAYQHIEKRTDEEQREYSEMKRDYDAQKTHEKLDELKRKEEQGLFKDVDYLNRIGLQLDDLNHNIRTFKNVINEQYLTVYFTEVAKIPEFYTWEEWKETEAILFNHMLQELKGHFSSRGIYQSSMRENAEKTFNSEREKYIKAKERNAKGVKIQ